MKILFAAHLGMCFGVRDAIELAVQQNRVARITVLGDLVHNETVLTDLRSQGLQFEQNVAAITTPTVMITAHGASQQTMNRVRAHGLAVVEATCPLVLHAHRAVQKLVRDGYHPVIVGKKDHVEVRGITEDLAECDVILTEEDVAAIQERPRFGVAAQTTQPLDKVHGLVLRLQARFPEAEVCFVDTVCQPTKQRQRAAVEVAQQSDAVVVIGGANSNNTRELAATCAEHCPRVFHVRGAVDLRSIWFNPFDTVGVTAGTSTPDQTITEVVQWLEAFASFQQPRTEEMQKETVRANEDQH